MTVLIINANHELVERFLDSGMCRNRLAAIIIVNGETTICLDDSTYTIYAGDEFITISSGNNNFTIYNGEYDALIVE